MPQGLDSLLDAFELKDEKRTGWVMRGIDEPESVASHTWGMAFLCLIYSDFTECKVEKDRAIKMALIHDLAEAQTGDIATRAKEEEQVISPKQKEELERTAMLNLLEPFLDTDIMSLWEEYEERDTATAKFVKDMDSIDRCLQALKYELEGRYNENDQNKHFDEFKNLDEFFATAAPDLHTHLGEALFEEIKNRYEEQIGRTCKLTI